MMMTSKHTSIAGHFNGNAFFSCRTRCVLPNGAGPGLPFKPSQFLLIISASAGVNEATPHWDLCLHFKICRNITLLLLRHFTWAICQSNLSIPWMNHVSRCVQKAVRMKEQKWSFSSHVSITTRALKTRLF